MADSFTDEQAEELVYEAKLCTGDDWKKLLAFRESDAHSYRGTLVVSGADSLRQYHVHLREARNAPANFSVGIRTVGPDGRLVNLRKLCGPSPNEHINRLEPADSPLRGPIVGECHIHYYRQEYHEHRRHRSDAFALPSKAFRNYREAVNHLAKLCKLPDHCRMEQPLFPEEFL